MKKFYKYFLLIFLVLVFGCRGMVEMKPLYKYSLIFTANTGGNIKNCFCRIRRGGILERSYLFKKLINKSEKYFIFDCGNSISSNFVSREKLLKIMEYLKYNAYFVSTFEYKDNKDLFNNVKEKTKIKMSSFTVLNEAGNELFTPYIEKNILGKKIGFVSITGFTKLPGYYGDIQIKDLSTAILSLKTIHKQFDQLFIITDYPQMEKKLEDNGIDNILTVFHLNMTRVISNTDWHEGKLLSLITSGKFFWHLSLGIKEDSKINIIENLVEVKESIGTDKELEKMIED